MGTHVVLKPTQSWHASNRIAVYDSAFLLVNTAVQLEKRQLGCIGVVKTSTKRYPIEPLQDTILPVRGQYTGMSTSTEGITYMDYVWSD